MQLAWNYVDLASRENIYRNVCFGRSGSQVFIVIWLPFGKRSYTCFDV